LGQNERSAQQTSCNTSFEIVLIGFSEELGGAKWEMWANSFHNKFVSHFHAWD
jgi:hypothetical protein